MFRRLTEMADNFKLAKKMLKIMKSGSYFLEDREVSLKNFIDESVKNIEMGTIESLITKETTKIGDNENKVCVQTVREKGFMLNVPFMYNNNTSGTKDAYTPKTIVLTMTKKKFKDNLDLLEDSEIGAILRTTTFGMIYKEIKESWQKVVEEKTDLTKILFVPDVKIILSPSGKPITPISFNVLIIAVPTEKEYKKLVDDIDIETINSRIIADIFESSIRLGCKAIVVNPSQLKVFRNNKGITSKFFKAALTSDRINDNFKVVHLTNCYFKNKDDINSLFLI